MFAFLPMTLSSSRYKGRRCSLIVTVGEFMSVDLALLASFLDLVVSVEQGQGGASKGDGEALGVLPASRRRVP